MQRLRQYPVVLGVTSDVYPTQTPLVPVRPANDVRSYKLPICRHARQANIRAATCRIRGVGPLLELHQDASCDTICWRIRHARAYAAVATLGGIAIAASPLSQSVSELILPAMHWFAICVIIAFVFMAIFRSAKQVIHIRAHEMRYEQHLFGRRCWWRTFSSQSVTSLAFKEHWINDAITECVVLQLQTGKSHVLGHGLSRSERSELYDMLKSLLAQRSWKLEFSDLQISQPRTYQFNLRTLFIATTVAACFFGCYRFFGLVPTFIGTLGLVIAGGCYLALFTRSV